MCYANQLTFFCGCMVLHSRLATSSCLRRFSSDSGGAGVQGSDTPARFRRKSVAAKGGARVVKAATWFIQRTYPSALLRWIGKLVVVVLFIIYTIVSSWGVSRLEESFQLESVIPPESYYTKHRQVRSKLIKS